MSIVAPGGCVLVVEDHRELAENVAEILAEVGYLTEIAASAEEAMRLVGERDLVGVVVDYKLPGISGVDLINALRARGFDRPIIMVSAFASDDVVRSAASAGALAVLEKPVRMSELLLLTREFAHRRHDVLIVEDNRALAHDLAEALSSAGVEPTTVASVHDALAQHTLPRAVLLDLRLPDGSGVELARLLLARDPRLRVFVMTGYPDEALDIIDRVDQPVVTKPADLANLVERVARAVNR